MVKLEQRDITVAQKNDLRRTLKREGKSLIELQSRLVKGDQGQAVSLSTLELIAIVDSYLSYDFQVKALEYGYADYRHDETDLSDIQIAELVMSVITKEFWNTELEKKS